MGQLAPISVTVAEASRITGYSVSFIRLLIGRRRLPSVRLGRSIRVLVTDLEDLLQSHRLGEARRAPGLPAPQPSARSFHPQGGSDDR